MSSVKYCVREDVKKQVLHAWLLGVKVGTTSLEQSIKMKNAHILCSSETPPLQNYPKHTLMCLYKDVCTKNFPHHHLRRKSLKEPESLSMNEYHTWLLCKLKNYTKWFLDIYTDACESIQAY